MLLKCTTDYWGLCHSHEYIYIFLNHQSEYKVLYELMFLLSGSLTCRLPNVMRFPPARRSLVSSIIVDWCLAPRRWGFYLKSNSTNYADRDHHWVPPPIRKSPVVEPGTEPGTSWLVVRSSDHEAFHMNMATTFRCNLLRISCFFLSLWWNAYWRRWLFVFWTWNNNIQ